MTAAKNFHTQGFTIVELLVVIIVIGILATVTVVSYQGITIRAENTKIINAADQWKDILNSYAALHGGSLTTDEADDSTPVCLGSTADYPATSQFAAGECVSDGGPAWATTADNTNNTLTADSGDVSQKWTKTFGKDNFWGDTVRGIQYANSSQSVIVYTLQGGNLDCGIAGAQKETEEDVSAYNPDVTTCLLPVDLRIL